MQCSDFCHVYKGIVPHRLSVTRALSRRTHLGFMGLNLLESSFVDMDKHVQKIMIFIIIIRIRITEKKL